MMLCWGTLLSAQDYTFEYTEEGIAIYEDIIALKLEQADLKLEARMGAEPRNLSYLHLQSYLDFFALFISEDQDYLRKAQVRKSAIISELKKLPNSNPYKKFAIAEVQLHSAINRSKFGQVLKSARELLAAYNNLKENEKAHPDFILNKKSLSVIHSLAETVSIPGIIKKLFGIKGSLAQGLDEIENLISYSHKNDKSLFKEELDAIYLYILLYQANDSKKAMAYLDKSRLKPRESLLATFMIAKIYQKLGMNDLALTTLENKPQGAGYSEFLYLDLMEGICKLRKLDTGCTWHIHKYLDRFHGRHYIKEGYQKLAWAKLVFDEDVIAYKSYIGKTSEGEEALVDGDKQAVRESKTHDIPSPELLTARLLSDGGYHGKAYTYLVQKAYKFTGMDRYALEFNYRMGRICQALKNYPDAIEYYKQTIEDGIKDDSYFACNAALQLGIIFEELAEYGKARSNYDSCLDMNPSDYKYSLHQKAKTGLSRLQYNKEIQRNAAADY